MPSTEEDVSTVPGRDDDPSDTGGRDVPPGDEARPGDERPSDERRSGEGSTASLIKAATWWYLANRLVTFVALALAQFVLGSATSPREVMRLGDGKSYLGIAQYGYFDLPATEGPIYSSIGFFPLLPALIRAVDVVLPGDGAVAAFVVCGLAAWAATVAVALLARDIYDHATGVRAAALLCAFPGAFVFSLAYTEGLLIAGAAAALLLLRHERWAWAGVAGAVATLARPSGVAVVVAAAVVAAVAIHRRQDWAALLAPVISAAGMGSYLVYLWVRTGDPDAWFANQRDFWGQRNDLGGYVIDWFSMLGRTEWERFDHYMFGWIMVALVAVLVVFVRRRPDLATTAYVAASLVITLSSNLGPRPRFLLAAFPLLLPFAHRLRGARFERTVAVGFGLLTVLLLYYAIGIHAARARFDVIGIPVI